MLKGGNGCAREGQSAFRMETEWEGYTWGGGGRMAQKSLRNSSGPEGCEGQSEEFVRRSVNQELLTELPGIVDD